MVSLRAAVCATKKLEAHSDVPEPTFANDIMDY